MPIKQGLPRTRSIMLDDLIASDNPVRVFDAFVDSLDLGALGFRQYGTYPYGAPAFPALTLLKIYLYGYHNRIRSSRKLETECTRNLELIWLTASLMPCYHTISTFRTYKKAAKDQEPAYNHRQALRGVFRAFNQILDEAQLFGKKTVAIDGTKIRAQNSRKNNISEDKIQKRLDYHENRFAEYLDELDRADEALRKGETPVIPPGIINKALDEIQHRTQKLEGLLDVLHEAQVEDPTLRQISLTDPDARSLPMNNMGHTDIAYNIQSAVDDQHYLVAHFSVENISDIHLLSKTATAAQSALKTKNLDVLADKGYHYGAELQKCAEAGITTYVAHPDQDYKTKEEGFRKEDFEYDADNDRYICPIGEELTTNGTVYKKHGKNGQLQTQFRVYRLSYSKCQKCICAAFCLTAASHAERHGRHIDRSIYEEAVTANRLRVLNDRDKYKRRQAIVEHPYGTIKRSWGFYYTLLKGKEKVSGEYSLVFLAYNMRRAVSILGVKDLLERIKVAFFYILAVWRGMERQNRNLGSENFSVVWQYRVAHRMARAA